ncbi:SMI1/KNR4 family protein [Streptomyces sp. NA04227]|uniref:SMI1/KNR4 family protein n=1 Tax=Streptomyces sp. NA04227 TaxID=2742136 RepID=UPI0015916AFA|nr:SMI1/KNR4 family protein [Streptomyces sp. NA04227]QKW07954.1 SMI1/KNR4 family protein [Streptomyces sp. NA04227]
MTTRRPQISLDQLLERLAHKVAGAAPEGWRRGRVSAVGSRSGSAQYAGWYELGDGRRAGMEVEVIGDRYWECYFGEVAPERLAVEFVVEASGRFEAFTSPDAERTFAAADRLLLVRDPDGLPPEPGDEQEGPADPTYAGDPDEAVRLFREYLRLRAGILGHDGYLNPPLDAASRERLLRRYDVALPPDLLALYGEFNGEYDEGMLFENQTWYALEGALDQSSFWFPTLKWSDNPLWSAVPDSDPPGAVRRSVHRAGWHRFATNTGGDFLAVDLDPGPGGRPGQIIRLDRDYGACYVADSMTTLLRHHVDALRRGDYRLRTHDLDAADLEDLDDLDGVEDLDDGEDPDNAEEFAGLDPENLDPDLLDRYLDREGMERGDLRLFLTVETGLPRERHAPVGSAATHRVTLSGEGADFHAGLVSLRRAPVEALRLVLDATAPTGSPEGAGSSEPTGSSETADSPEPVDLAPLLGHPTLRALTLVSECPVDVRVLPTLPKLRGLDLSKAEAHGIDVMTTELDGLAFLCLRYAQWQAVPEPGSASSLAAVALGGDASPRETYDWASRFGAEASFHEGNLEGE